MRSYVGGGLLLLLSAFMLWGFLRSNASLASGPTVLALLIAVALPAGAGAALIGRQLSGGRRQTSRREQLRRQTLEAEVLRLAGERGGRLTLVEVLTEMAVTTEAAQSALDSLVMQEIADLAVTDSGTIVYTFHDVERALEKSRARHILE